MQTSTANHNSRVPLFPRGAVTPVCREAVSGSISIGDTTRWSGVKGAIVVEAGELTTGADFRDAYARKAVLQTQAFPRIEFDIDSLTQIQVQGDTIRAFAVGTFKLLGKAHLKTGRVVAWRVPEGLRVRAQIEIPAKDMINVYGMSKIALNLGVVLGRWDTLHMGIDIILASTNTAL